MTPSRNRFVTEEDWLGVADRNARRRYDRGARVLACAFVLLFVVGSAARAQSNPALSATEQRIRDYVRAHQVEQIALLEKAVNISSGTFNLAGVREVGKLFAPEFFSIGIFNRFLRPFRSRLPEMEAILEAAPSKEMAVGVDADQAVDTSGDPPDEMAIVGRIS